MNAGQQSGNLPSVDQLLNQLAPALQAYVQARNMDQPLMVGIHTGGAWIASALLKTMGVNWPLGLLDISFYRDDYTERGLNPSVKSSELPFATEGQHLILVDDVLMSGRTIRAALNELFDYGRPASVTLVTLLSLPGRELPIQPDLCAAALELPANQRIKLSGPDPLQLNLIQLDKMEHQA